MKREKNKTKSLLGGGLKRLAVCALLAALSIVCGKYLAFNAGPVMRFSFENLPILLAGIAIGPIWGCAVGTVADLLGCVLVGYTINPLVTLGAMSVGLLGGFVFWLCKRLPLSLGLALSVAVAHTIGSLLLKTVGLSAFYDMPFYLLLLWRLLNYVVVGVAEGLLLYFILKNKAVQRLLEAIR